MKVIIDTREQLPYSFERYAGQVEVKCLPTGDYSVEGFETQAAIERKSIDDLVGCLTTGRARFERELARLALYECAAVVVECSMEDIAHGRYRSGMKPHAALQSIFAFQIRYCPFIFAGNRAGAEYTTFWLLEKYLTEQSKKAAKAAATAQVAPGCAEIAKTTSGMGGRILRA